ncbi:MAG TPA: hypothetical protein ENJ16_02685, partial [Planctomycetaceae bacterium]|nr:hypothetical protein [Planctomycetaceae bacterium]
MNSSSRLLRFSVTAFACAMSLPVLAILSALLGADATWGQEKGHSPQSTVDERQESEKWQKIYQKYLPEVDDEARMTIWEFHSKLKQIPVAFGTSWPGCHGFIVVYDFGDVGFYVDVDHWGKVFACTRFVPRESPTENHTLWWGLLPGRNQPYQQPPLIEIDRFLPDEHCEDCPCKGIRGLHSRREGQQEGGEFSDSQPESARSSSAGDERKHGLEKGNEPESAGSDPWKRWIQRIPDIRGRKPMMIRDFHRKLKWLPIRFWSSRPTSRCSLVWYDFGSEVGSILVFLDGETRVLGVIDYREGKDPAIQEASGARWGLLPGRNKPYEQPPLVEIDDFLPEEYRKTPCCRNCHCKTHGNSLYSS